MKLLLRGHVHYGEQLLALMHLALLALIAQVLMHVQRSNRRALQLYEPQVGLLPLKYALLKLSYEALQCESDLALQPHHAAATDFAR